MRAQNSGVLTIIIVNYHSADLLLGCLHSLYEYNTIVLEVIVVDNSNSSEDKALITSVFPGIRWIDIGYNAGFARANNVGMRQATGDAFLLLNPDTICIDDSINRCFQLLMQSSSAAAGVQLVDRSLQPQISGSYFVKGGLNHLLPIPYWGAFIRWIAYRAKTKAPGVMQPETVQEVDWISGAFLMVKKEAVAKVGMMDEDFFLYGEEVEWCSRLKKAGPLVLFGTLRIIHLEGATINKSQGITEQGYYNLYDRKGLQLMVSNHLRVRKQYGVGWFIFLLLNYSWGFLFYLFCNTVHRLLTGRNPVGEWQKIGAFGQNIWAIWRLSPSIIRNRRRFYKMF